MDTKVALLKEIGKLSAYAFVTLGLAQTAIKQLNTTQQAFEVAFKKA